MLFLVLTTHYHAKNAVTNKKKKEEEHVVVSGQASEQVGKEKTHLSIQYPTSCVKNNKAEEFVAISASHNPLNRFLAIGGSIIVKSKLHWQITNL